MVTKGTSALRHVLVGVLAFSGALIGQESWVAAVGPATGVDLSLSACAGVATALAVLVLGLGRVPEYSWPAWIGMIAGRIPGAYAILALIVGCSTWLIAPKACNGECESLVILTALYVPIVAAPLTLALSAVRPRWGRVVNKAKPGASQ